ncbi:MAG: MerR family transcriptional regulator [Spirochaetales bacterium]|nr:MerR family transcriptional regulator [Spirochaetales bacterium]
MNPGGLLISEVARLFRISADTLRFYDKKGILSPSERRGNNYRLYNYQDISRLTAVLLLRKMDLPLKEIAAFLEDYSIDDTMDLLESRISFLDHQIQELSYIRDSVQSQMTYLKDYRDNAGQIILRESRRTRSVFYIKKDLHINDEIDEMALVRSYLNAAEEQIPEDWYISGHLGTEFRPDDSGLYHLAYYCYEYFPSADRHIDPGSYVSYLYKGIEQSSFSERLDKMKIWMDQKGLEGDGPVYQLWQIDDFHSHRKQDWVNEMQIFIRQVVQT